MTISVQAEEVRKTIKAARVQVPICYSEEYIAIETISSDSEYSDDVVCLRKQDLREFITALEQLAKEFSL